MALRQREFDRAAALYRESLTRWSKMGGRRGIAECLEGTAGLALARGELERSVRLYAAAEAIRRAIGALRRPRSREEYERDLTAIRAGLDEEVFATGWKDGQALTLDQAIELARHSCGVSGPEPWDTDCGLWET
jgi:hypothetical protein